MFLKYIVFLFFCFNISASLAAEVVYDFNEEPAYEQPAVSGKTNLPDAARLRELLQDGENSPIGRMLIIGKYFDEKYPGKLIEADFSTDIAAIFPELTQQEIYERTKFVRQAVNAYRAGSKKFTEIKEELLAPKEPPLIVNEEDYDLPGQHDYVEAPEGQFAVIYDFKKVLSYGSNPRDIKAMEAYRQRKLDNKKKKTAFDKFRSMVGKLEFSKIPFYGYSLPNPFVGNAGVGEWQSKDGFAVRLISDTAEIADKSNLLAAVHVKIPNHRFILANDLSDRLLKPKIELYERENIESYDVFYPIPVKVADASMSGAYAGDPAFPIILRTENAHQGIKLKAKVTFQSCDYELNCQQMEFLPELTIDKAQENASSSVMNFVKQNYYNLPPENNDRIQLKSINTTRAEDGKKLDKIRFVFEYSGTIDNFSLFLDDGQHTLFEAPKISVQGSKIYVTVVPENHQNDLYGRKFEMTVRLNAYTSLRQKIILTDFKPGTEQVEISDFKVVLYGFLIGLLFNLMPIAFPFWMFPLSATNRIKNTALYFRTMIVGVFAGCNSIAAVLIWARERYDFLIWGLQYNNFYYLSAVILLFIGLLFSLKYLPVMFKTNLKLKGFIGGILLTVLLPYSFTPFLRDCFTALLTMPEKFVFMFFNVCAAGMSALFLLLQPKYKLHLEKNVSEKIRRLLQIIGIFAVLGIILWLLLIFFLQISFINFLKVLILVALAGFVFNYAFSFLLALSQLKLSVRKKAITAKIAAIVFISLAIGMVWIIGKNTSYTTEYPETHDISETVIKNKILEGKVVLIGITADWSPLSHFNNITVLNQHHIKRWAKAYNFEYIPLSIRGNSLEAAKMLRRYHRSSVPFYVLYSYHFEDGLVFSSFLIDSMLEQTIENAAL